MPDLSNEVHHRLTPTEMAEIREYREKLAYKSVEDTYKLYYEWAKTGKLSRREHTLLGIYIFGER